MPLRWIETDSSDMFLPDVVWEHNRWTAVVANKADAEATGTADIVGISCQPDRIVPDAPLPDVAVGDVIACLDTGAYLVHGDQAEWIKRPETVEDIFRRDIVPQRLRDG